MAETKAKASALIALEAYQAGLRTGAVIIATHGGMIRATIGSDPTKKDAVDMVTDVLKTLEATLRHVADTTTTLQEP